MSQQLPNLVNQRMIQVFNQRNDLVEKEKAKHPPINLYQGKIINPIFHSTEIQHGVKRSISTQFLENLDDFLVKQRMLDIEDKSVPQKRLIISRDKYKKGTTLDEQIEAMRSSHVVEFINRGAGFKHNTVQIQEVQQLKKKRIQKNQKLDLSLTGNQRPNIDSLRNLDTSQRWHTSSSVTLRTSISQLSITGELTPQSERKSKYREFGF